MKNTYVVQKEGTDWYLIGYNITTPSESTFGNLENAVTFETLAAAQACAATIGGGTVGTTKPH